jgi:hypothetical protein
MQICVISHPSFIFIVHILRLYDDALATLSHLHILSNSAVKLALNSTFKTSFRQAITGR